MQIKVKPLIKELVSLKRVARNPQSRFFTDLFEKAMPYKVTTSELLRYLSVILTFQAVQSNSLPLQE
ncbi:MAG: hypothetical protein A2Y40_06650 [Candidatus Margulisbacteria bacterium GWF2_35_9]|nr:MAG: hypothetical protein A2Y40_06650 [Candidatus Margulisbacteria bacterium GWF2_35_9]